MQLTLEGAEELQAQLEALPEKVQTRLFKEALTDGAEVVAAAVAYAAPSKTGAMVAGIKVTSSNAGGEPSASVTVPPPGNMLEYGTKNKGTWDSIVSAVTGQKRSRSKNTGDVRMKARPFVRQGFEDSREEAYEAVGETLIESIEKEAFSDGASE